ncbi:UDP-N-acetylglucosamine 1-carboxyvinyltransferase [Kribbella sp. VKM Ac-2527]|uniref:UDP-N-acetylglucosamine 1-carboxyvinyltransferase n=1 Tax=Kribbella caucasensis TaxID=2512215 RepID=A0A4R6KLR8_9ACTN|nr:UDP-N-acetylglucosamine 1-carboxyvinyltransferase [Kribbella sp. VKM Ac-2527]TDO52497.1 UDP-N-acetylglucosamine 1-carboxyvinyltransferase [Kribbella sp. VKM Ac-2527]
MERFRIAGEARLEGSVEVAGAKNSVLKLMAAALLAEGTTTLRQVPGILDVTFMAQLLDTLGCSVKVDGDSGTATIAVPAEIGHQCDYALVRKLRASISVLGPLLGRCGRAEVALPGGDNIGSRGLNMHVAGLEAMGAKVHIEHGFVIAEAPQGLHGAEVWLDFPSVGATETIMMAAVLAKGSTVIENAAREPEIQDIAEMLVEMGAQIDGAGSPRIEVTGVQGLLQPVDHLVVPDRIVSGSWAFAAAITKGDVTITNGRSEHLELPLDKLHKAGAEITVLNPGFRVVMPDRPKSVDVVTLPYPGFPTDLQAFCIAMNAVSDGAAMVTENLFEGRFTFAQELTRLGAQVQTDGHHAVIRGVPRLSGAPVVASDIRAGAALVVAGLAAEGETIVAAAHHVHRGYTDFAGNLRRLGADVVVEPDDAGPYWN